MPDDVDMMLCATSSSASTTMAKTNSTSGATIHAMVQRVKRNDPTLTSLSIRTERGRGHFFRPQTTEDWQHIGEAIATNNNLLRLDLHCLIHDWVSTKTWKEFYANLNENTSIRRLALNQIDLYEGEIFTLHILQFLVNNTSLTSLSATNYSLGLEGTRLLSSALARKTSSSLKYLDLSSAGITDEACQELVVSALRSGHSGLRSLELNGNSIQNAGCVAIATTLLNNPKSMLIRLYLDNNDIDDEGAEALADGLASTKCCLKTLSIHGNAAITSRGYETFSNALCNAPHVDDILLSNHIIQRFGTDCNQLSAELKSSLGFNRVANKHHVANRKVVMHHFVYNCNISLFEGIPGSLVPHVLATIADHSIFKNGRTDAQASKECSFVKHDYRIRHLALHHIIRLCPSICERHLSLGGGMAKNSIERASKKMRLA